MTTLENLLKALENNDFQGHRDRKKAQKLRSILDAGRELFAEHGYEGTTTRAISDRAGIATGTLFSYFPDKRALLVQLFALDMGAAVDEAFAALSGSDASDGSRAAAGGDGPPRGERPVEALLIGRVMHLFAACFRYYERDLRLARSVIKEMMFLDPEPQRVLHAVTSGFIMRLAGEVEAAVERGEVRREVVGAVAAATFFAQYYLVLISWVNGMVPDTDTALNLLRQSLHLIHRGLGTDAAAEDAQPPSSQRPN